MSCYLYDMFFPTLHQPSGEVIRAVLSSACRQINHPVSGLPRRDEVRDKFWRGQYPVLFWAAGIRKFRMLASRLKSPCVSFHGVRMTGGRRFFFWDVQGSTKRIEDIVCARIAPLCFEIRSDGLQTKRSKCSKPETLFDNRNPVASMDFWKDPGLLLARQTVARPGI